MICLIAMVVFGLLGIFSIKYRVIAKEAFDCVFKRITLRKCTTGLDKRLKSQITGKLMKKSPKTGKFIYKHFEIISWFFTILLIASLIQSGVSGYNFVKYGNCNGKQSDEFCIFDPLGARSENPLLESTQSGSCSVDGNVVDNDDLITPEIGQSASFGNKDSKLKIIEFGCYVCEYTKLAEDVYESVRNNFKDDIEFVFKHYPVHHHVGSFKAAIASECVRLQSVEKFWEYHKKIMDNHEPIKNKLLVDFAEDIEIDIEDFYTCLIENKTKTMINNDIYHGKKSNIYGTPTVFIGDEVIVGPKDYFEVSKIIKDKI